MDNKIDVLLKEIGSDVPKINPTLSSKIYNKALDSESRKTIPFFKKPLIIAFTSLIIFVVTLTGFIKLGNVIKESGFSSLESVNGVDSPAKDFENSFGGTNQFVPNLSPTVQNTVFIDYHYAIYTSNYDIVTIIVNNKINYQKVYIKSYNLKIDDLKVNNGDVTISQVIIENELFFEIVFNNKNTSIHYLDLCFEKGKIENILSNQSNFKIGFVMYINEVNVNEGYGYDFKVENVFDIREGNNI